MNETLFELRHHLQRAWGISYRMGQGARNPDDEKFYDELASKINDLEFQMIKREESGD